MIFGNYRQNRERAFKFFCTFSQIDETSQMHHKSNMCICIIKHNFSVYTSNQLWFFFFHKCYICGLTGNQETEPSEVATVNDSDIPDTPGM